MSLVSEGFPFTSLLENLGVLLKPIKRQAFVIVQRTEMASKINLLSRRDLLASDNDHQIFQPNFADFRGRRVIHGFSQIESHDFRAQRIR